MKGAGGRRGARTGLCPDDEGLQGKGRRWHGRGCVLGSWFMAAWSLGGREHENARKAVRILLVGDEEDLCCLLAADGEQGAAGGGAFLRKNQPTSIGCEA